MARRVKLSDLLGEPLEVELPAVNGGEPKVAKVAPLGVDDMMLLFELETKVETDGDDDAVEMARTRDFVCDLISRDNPGIFPTVERSVEEADGEGGVRTVTKQMPVYPNWPPQVILALMAAMAGDMSVADAVTKGVLGDDDEQQEAQAVREQENADALERGEHPDASEVASEGDDPSTLTQPSPTPSLKSDERTDGDPNGGSPPDAPGTPSQATSDISDVHV